jgi:hypothetical protein
LDLNSWPNWFDLGLVAIAVSLVAVVVSIVAIAVSLMALGVSILERIDRKDSERNAIRPVLEAELHEGARAGTASSRTHLVVIENIGRGPARNVVATWDRDPTVEPRYIRVATTSSPKTLRVGDTLPLETAYDALAAEWLGAKATDVGRKILKLGLLTVSYEDSHGRRGVLAGTIELRADQREPALVFGRSRFEPSGSKGLWKLWGS